MDIALYRPPLIAWLAARSYSGKTVADTLGDLQLACRRVDEHEVLPERLRTAVRRLEAAADDTRDATLLQLFRKLAPALPARVVAPRFHGAGAKRAESAREARSFEDDAWDLLVAKLQSATDPASRALLVMSRTGFRVGDMLRLERADIAVAAKTGKLRVVLKGASVRTVDVAGAAEEWAALFAAFLASPALDIAHWVSPGCGETIHGASGAYQRMRRTLRTVAQDAGLTEAVWTHRLRRTVGVRAYRVTEDVLAVRDLLMHRKPATSLGYLSEARPDRVADLQQKIRGKI